MLHSLCVYFVGLCFIASVAFLLFQDPSKNHSPTASRESRQITANQSSKPSSKSGSKTCFRNKMADVLLVVVYNHPLYDSADLLRQFYEPVFPNIYFCGELENRTFGIHSSRINRGIYGYKCLADAIEHHNGFSGYLYINDDVIVNYWNLHNFRFNFSKIGESSNQFGKTSINAPGPKDWYWWISPYGFNNCKAAIEEITSKAKKNSKNFKNMLANFQHNGQGDQYCYNGRSDIVFIPGHLALKFYEISSVFYRHNVFLEIAIPTILRFAAREEDMATLHGMYLPGDVRKKDPRVTDSRYFWTMYFKKPSLWFIHPFKLHHYEDHNRDMNIELLQRILVRKTKELTSCTNE